MKTTSNVRTSTHPPASRQLRAISRRPRTYEPARWAMFGAGGELAAVLLPTLIILLGLVLPLLTRPEHGAELAATDPGILGDPFFHRAASFLTHPLVSLVLCGLLGLILWHCCHRAFHFLHDLQLHPPKLVMWLIYGFAVVVPLAASALIIVT